jgi:outer membrane protein TolC
MERNRGFMKAFVGLIFLTFAWSGFAQEPETRAPRSINVQQTFAGSVSQGTATGTSIPLSVADAIDRALKYNLGSIVSDQQTRAAKADRLRKLSELLPKVNAGVTGTVQQTNLAAFGFSSFPGIRSVVGPFSVIDARARYTQAVLDFRRLHEFRSAAEDLKASINDQEDVREIVTLVVTDLYLETVAASSRLEAARAQLRTDQAVFNRTSDLKESGVAAGIDVVRAQVQLQARQQRVLASENELAKAKLNLARAIGLPQGQEFTQTDTFLTNAPAVSQDFNELLSTAVESRPDYRRAMALVRSAEESRKAAEGRARPSVVLSGDYGDLGRTLGSSHGTFVAQVGLLIPIYTGRNVEAEILESDALLEQRRAELASLRDRIEYEIRTANLDIQSALAQVRVAESARTLARQQLMQAQDRFVAGVANSLEVVQAQDAIATADENYISSLYTLNIAQASLSRAVGAAEKTIKAYFGGK